MGTHCTYVYLNIRNKGHLRAVLHVSSRVIFFPKRAHPLRAQLNTFHGSTLLRASHLNSSIRVSSLCQSGSPLPACIWSHSLNKCVLSQWVDKLWPHGPYLALHLFLYSPWAKPKEQYFKMSNYMKQKISVSTIKVLLGCSHTKLSA